MMAVQVSIHYRLAFHNDNRPVRSSKMIAEMDPYIYRFLCKSGSAVVTMVTVCPRGT